MASDWKHSLVDGIPYCISCSTKKIRFEGKDQLSRYMFSKSKQHRENLVRYATNILKEISVEKSPEAWVVDFDGSDVTLDSQKRVASPDAGVAVMQPTVMQPAATPLANPEIDSVYKRQEAMREEARIAEAARVAAATAAEANAKALKDKAEAQTKLDFIDQQNDQKARNDQAAGVGQEPVVQMFKPAQQNLTNTLNVSAKDKPMANISEGAENILKALYDAQIETEGLPEGEEGTERAAKLLETLNKFAAEFPFLKEKKEDKGDDKAPAKDSKPNPFEKKDEKKEEKKDDKPAPFEKKDDKKEEKKDDKKPEAPKSEKKDDEKKPAPFEKKEEKKDDKKPEAPKSEKKDDKGEGKKEEKSDEKEAEKAIGIIEKLLGKEEGVGDMGEAAPLKEALEKIKVFLGIEKKEELGLPGMDIGKPLPGMGMPKMPGMDLGKPKMPGMPSAPNALDMKNPHDKDIIKTGPAVPLPNKPVGAPPAGPKFDLKKEMGPLPGGPKPPPPGMPGKPLGPLTKKLPVINKDEFPEAEGKKPVLPVIPAKASFNINDRVWLKTAAGEEYNIGDEPGRVIDHTEDGKPVVDWPYEGSAPTVEENEDLVAAISEDGNSSELFAPEVNETDTSILFNDNTAFTSEPAAPMGSTPELALANASFADMMSKHSSNLDPEGTVYHVSTGMKGTVVSAAAGGRYNVKFGDKVTTVWPFEISTYSA